MENENGTVELVDLKSDIIALSVVLSNVRYYLYTRANPTTPDQILNSDVTALNSTNFDPAKKILFITHGWHNDNESDIFTYMVPAALNNSDINVIAVDWSDIAQHNYLTAQSSVVDVGEILGTFINDIQTTYNLSGSQFYLVGHSLGAHISGNAGAILVSKVKSIVGCDPAAPLFTLGNINNRLDPTDAQFVQVIHTNGLLLGFASSIGNADYYPNGGLTQPGCSVDITGSCSHSRSYLYYIESLLRGDVFLSYKCSHYSYYLLGLCNSNDDSYMGLLEVDT